MKFHTHPGVWMGMVLVLMATLCHSQVNRCFPNEKPEFPQPNFSASVEDFGLDLFRNVARSAPRSVFISPYSLWSVLTLTYFGSEGKTQGQLKRALNLRSKSGTFSSWNALKLMLQSTPENGSGATFNSLNRAYFATDIVLKRCLSNILFDLRRLNFRISQAAADVINHDVSIATEGKIDNLIDILPPDTRFVLLNAVYFKGLWASPFDPKETRPQEFIVPPGKSAGVVQMMVQSGTFKHGYEPALGATILELPYENSNTSMFLLLPDNLETAPVIEALNRDTFLLGYTKMTKKMVDVILPRFKITTRLEDQVVAVLKDMGVVDLFNPVKANLTAFTRNEDLYADKVIHVATAEVTEEGTVAAAASSVIITRFGGPKTSFVCNRPFVFLITDKNTGITLFAGKVDHPADLENL